MQIEDVTPNALIAKPETIEAKVAEWSATDADLRAAVDATKGLTIKGHAEGPKKGREAVHKALMTLADCRVSIEKRREELKRPILDLGKLVDSEAKRLTAITAPREAELRTDRDAYDAEEAKAKAEAERIAKEAKEAEERKAREEAQAILNAKIKRIAEAGGVPDLIWLAGAGDDEVESLISRLTKEKQDREEAARIAEIERLEREAKEAADRKIAEEAERVRLAEQAKRDEEARIRQAEIAEKNRAEAKKLADEREAFERQQREAREAQERIDAERRKREEAEQAKRDAEAEAERIAQEQAQAEGLRAAQAPDREKIAAWAKVVRGALAPCPAVDAGALAGLMQTARIAVEEILNRLEREMLEG